MTANRLGEVYFVPDCKFPDGQSSNKLLIILGLNPIGDYVVLRTTSQARLRRTTPGCQNGDREPGFFIPQGTSQVFPLDTWVCLDYSLTFEVPDFEKCIGKVYEYRGQLEQHLICQLLRCSIGAEDLPGFTIDAIYQSIELLNCS